MRVNGSGKKWVLVVDDDEDNRDTLVDFLIEAGYLAKGAADCEQALDLLRDDKPCLVLSDVLMKDMHGKDLLMRARRLFNDAVPPFVFVTGAHPSMLEDIS
ncbi:MAG: response regulator, partial [Bacteroidota bacterium]